MNIQLPERHGAHEAGRMAVQGRRTDDDSDSTLVVVHENDGSWTFHGLGAPGVRLTRSDAVEIAQGICKASK